MSLRDTFVITGWLVLSGILSIIVVFSLIEVNKEREVEQTDHQLKLLEIRLIGCELTELDEVEKTATFGCDIDKPDIRISQDYARRLGRLK